MIVDSSDEDDEEKEKDESSSSSSGSGSSSSEDESETNDKNNQVINLCSNFLIFTSLHFNLKSFDWC
jgi:hypothetical protein